MFGYSKAVEIQPRAASITLIPEPSTALLLDSGSLALAAASGLVRVSLAELRPRRPRATRRDRASVHSHSP